MDGYGVIGLLSVWWIVGIIACRFNRCGDWIIMIADPRNTDKTWLAIPTLILCWILWPIARPIARKAFLFSITR